MAVVLLDLLLVKVIHIADGVTKSSNAQPNWAPPPGHSQKPIREHHLRPAEAKFNDNRWIQEGTAVASRDNSQKVLDL